MGIYFQKWTVHESPKMEGLLQFCQQLCESFVQMMKRELRVRGNSSPGFLKRMWKFSDLYTVCAMGHDEVNFWHVLQRTLKSHKLLWNEEQTPMIYDILENQMPDKWFELWLHVKDINCGDPIPAEIVNVLNTLDPADAADIAALHEANAEVIIADDVEGDDPNIDELPPDPPGQRASQQSRVQRMIALRNALLAHQAGGGHAGISDADD